jgi:DNA mismatch repair protein MutS2
VRRSIEYSFEDDGFDVMLLPGPNTGGKTVVLKTLGLLSLMSACGCIFARAGQPLEVAASGVRRHRDEQSMSSHFHFSGAHQAHRAFLTAPARRLGAARRSRSLAPIR